MGVPLEEMDAVFGEGLLFNVVLRVLLTFMTQRS